MEHIVANDPAKGVGATTIIERDSRWPSDPATEALGDELWVLLEDHDYKQDDELIDELVRMFHEAWEDGYERQQETPPCETNLRIGDRAWMKPVSGPVEEVIIEGIGERNGRLAFRYKVLVEGEWVYNLWAYHYQFDPKHFSGKLTPEEMASSMVQDYGWDEAFEAADANAAMAADGRMPDTDGYWAKVKSLVLALKR
jgi:hypothetical protein